MRLTLEGFGRVLLDVSFLETEADYAEQPPGPLSSDSVLTDSILGFTADVPDRYEYGE